MTSEFTPTQQKIMNLLSDGEPHGKIDIYNCLPYELGQLNSVHRHLTHIRRKLKPKGEGILCVIVNRKLAYRYVAFRGKSAEVGE